MKNPIVEHVTGGKALPAEVLDQIVAKTDGIPLFVEELTKHVLESEWLMDDGECYQLKSLLPPLAIPATLQDSLIARLDRLASVKEVAQLGATIGREFSYQVLQAVSPLADTGLRESLAQLLDAELISQHGVVPESIYSFKHALIQDVAYASMLRSTRQDYHRRIPEVLAEQSPELVETQPELMAHHYTEAGLNDPAIDYWYQAGKTAIERLANVEATRHLKKGLELLPSLPETSERVQRELDLSVALGSALMATKGYTDAEVESVLSRARALCQQMSDSPHLFPILVGLRLFYSNQGALQVAREIGEELLSLAQRLQHEPFQLEAHYALGVNLFRMGELTQAQGHMENCTAFSVTQEQRLVSIHPGADHEVGYLTFASRVLLHLGYPSQALEKAQEAVTCARKLSHPLSLVHALGFLIRVHIFRKEYDAIHKYIETILTVSTEHGIAHWLGHRTIYLGWLLSVQGQPAEGVPLMHQGLEATRAFGQELDYQYLLALLSEGYGLSGRLIEGLEVLDEALVLVERYEERYWEAELHRLKGGLLLGLSDDNETEAGVAYQKALSIARFQQAKSLELRAATSLARLWQQQGKRKDAYDQLAPVYKWFTEGFDTPDLQEAKALLVELGV